MDSSELRPLALVTGASSGIGLQLARLAAQNGFDLVIAADEPLEGASAQLASLGAEVRALQVDLAERKGVDQFVAAAGDRRIDALFANAGHGLGGAFLDQEFAQVEHVVNTNVMGTIYLLHGVARRMRDQGQGRILVTGSIAGFQPGSFQAVYNATKAFVDSFSLALHNELKGTGITVSCLMPGVTDTHFFERADMLDTKVGQMENKSDPADVAKIGFDAMMRGESDVVAGWKNKIQVALSKVMPADTVAEKHRELAQPRTANPA
jgi:short-subunit dehydrogenase